MQVLVAAGRSASTLQSNSTPPILDVQTTATRASSTSLASYSCRLLGRVALGAGQATAARRHLPGSAPHSESQIRLMAVFLSPVRRYTEKASLAAPHIRSSLPPDSAGAIRSVSPLGVITTLAGIASTALSGNSNGAATSARFTNPMAVSTDNSGGFFVADHGNNLVKRVNSAGVVSRVIGSAVTAGYAGDGSLATAAATRLSGPSAVVVDTFATGSTFVVRRFDILRTRGVRAKIRAPLCRCRRTASTT